MLNVIFLTEKFYRRYKDCPEIEQKTSRPYIRVGVLIDGVLWAIPMRSNINHEHTIWTDKANKCGIDFTKAVVIDNPAEYISSIKPHIRPNEFEVLKSINSYTIEQKMGQYIKKFNRTRMMTISHECYFSHCRYRYSIHIIVHTPNLWKT